MIVSVNTVSVIQHDISQTADVLLSLFLAAPLQTAQGFFDINALR